MSGNSVVSCLHTAPMVSDFACCATARGTSSAGPSSPEAVSSATATSARQIGELVLADLQLVAVLELVRVDPAAGHVGPVERAGVVQVPLAVAAHQHRVVARDGHVVEEDLGVRRAPDRQP